MGFGSVVSETFFGSTIPQYLLFFTIVGIGALVGRSLSFLYKRQLKQAVEATETELDDVIFYSLGRPVIALGVVLAIAIGRVVLTPVEPLASVLAVSVEIPVVICLAWISVRLTDGLIETYVMEYADETESRLDDELVPIASRIVNIAIVSIAGVVILDSIGYDVTAVIASLGVGGIAVAFASRKTMADVFGGAHILAAKPFMVDDIVDIDGTAGTVEDIGLRTTRIRDFDGRVVTVPNSTVASAEVKNITSEATRRVQTFIALPYGTTPGEMGEALSLLEDAMKDVDGVDPSGTGAWFWDYTESGLEIRADYYIEALDRWKEVRNAVNIEIQRALADHGFEVAVPTRTVRVDDRTDAVDPASALDDTDQSTTSS
jgi:MscS family membrane protein